MRRPTINALVTLLLVAALVTVSPGCSFVFDFSECDASADCQTFDQPDQGEFFVCSADQKCVLDPQRHCRTDSHCEGDQICQTEAGTCSADS